MKGVVPVAREASQEPARVPLTRAPLEYLYLHITRPAGGWGEGRGRGLISSSRPISRTNEPIKKKIELRLIVLPKLSGEN